MSEHITKQRTVQQNKALWLFMTLLAENLNDSGLDMKVVLKPQISIPWTKNSVHDYLWIPIQKAMYGTESTTFLHKLEQIEKVHKVLMRELGEKHEVEYISFPHDEQLQIDKMKFGK